MLVHPGNTAVNDILRKCIGTHGNDRYCSGIPSLHGTDLACRIPAIHIWHHNIHEDHIIIPRLRFFKFFTASSPSAAHSTRIPLFSSINFAISIFSSLSSAIRAHIPSKDISCLVPLSVFEISFFPAVRS